MSAATSHRDSEFARMSAEWALVASEPDPTLRWDAELARIRQEQARLRASGLWKSGGRTLLRALGVHHNEVLLCRALAWLLSPDGWHGLGPAVLDGVLTQLGIATEGSEFATVVTEEQRGNTRADIVVRFDGACVLIEAKVWAGEQKDQADRLADGWADEIPHLVFLTRDATAPTTAVTSRDAWRPMSWAGIAAIITACVWATPDCEPGVREYLRTLEIYGGTQP